MFGAQDRQTCVSTVVKITLDHVGFVDVVLRIALTIETHTNAVAPAAK